MIRDARPDEAARLTEIAHAAKRHWGYPEAWIAGWRDALTFTPERMAGWQVRVAEPAEGLAGVHAVSVEGDAAVLEHLWVDPPHIGRGVGRRLFEDAVRVAARLGAREMTIDSDPYAEAFYLRMGAVRIGEVRADVGGVARHLPRLRIAVGP